MRTQYLEAEKYHFEFAPKGLHSEVKWPSNSGLSLDLQIMTHIYFCIFVFLYGFPTIVTLGVHAQHAYENEDDLCMLQHAYKNEDDICMLGL